MVFKLKIKIQIINMMTDNMMALYYPESRPVTQDEAVKTMQSFAQQYGPNMVVEEFMTFSSNYYGVIKDTNSTPSIWTERH